jgi:7-carboxy-7-deazaguanine synthase
MNLPVSPDLGGEAHAPAPPPGSLPISESFFSIQGEGLLTGVPSWFVRLSGCNLRCAWCDTPYASWRPEGTNRTIADLVTEATSRSGVTGGLAHAVVTGGEPMMFVGVGELCRGLAGAGMHVTIETAGTIDRPDVTPRECALMSISPKLSNSTPSEANGGVRAVGATWARRHEQRRINLAALQGLLDRHPPTVWGGRQLKFVVAGEADLVEIDALLSRLRGWSASDILLMPEGTTPPTAERKAWVVNACTERGWRYCHRLHIELFGNTRGT